MGGIKGLSATAGLVFAEGRWQEGSPALLSPRTHGVWLGSAVFDGARFFEGCAPDLLAHCDRVVRSARAMGLAPMLSGGEIAELAWSGIARFSAATPLYIKPMFWAEDGFITPDPDTTRFALVLAEAPLPPATGFSAGLTRFHRPSPDSAPTEAKAACLYPNVGRGLAEVRAKGFETALVRDPLGNVAEFSYTNLFYAKEGQVHTPIPNGTFLNGLTRQRVISLLRGAGVEVIERTLSVAEVLDADEVFATGNYFKLGPCTRLEDRTFAPGPLYTKARALYWDFAKASAGS